MDISEVDYAASAETPSFVRFAHPQTGAPMGTDDNPAGAYVRASYSKTVMAMQAEAARDAMKKPKPDEPTSGIRETIVNGAARLTDRIVGLTVNGKPVTDFVDFYDRTFVFADDCKHMCFAQQVQSSASQAANFLPKASPV